jgi:hypothetical protein
MHRPDFGKIDFLHSKLKKKKMHLYPNKAKCTGKIIKAHSIQNSRSLEAISKNGHIYLSDFRQCKISP